MRSQASECPLSDWSNLHAGLVSSQSDGSGPGCADLVQLVTALVHEDVCGCNHISLTIINIPATTSACMARRAIARFAPTAVQRFIGSHLVLVPLSPLIDVVVGCFVFRIRGPASTCATNRH
jgi:hypothetical protein